MRMFIDGFRALFLGFGLIGAWSLSAAPADKTTVVLWTNSDLTGDFHAIDVTPLGALEGSKTVRRTELQNLKLEGRISSARLICGARKAQVSFSNRSTVFGDRIVLECDPYQNKTINFHETQNSNGVSLADDVAWVNLVVHAANHVSLNISALGALMFDSRVHEFLPSRISPAEASKVLWVDTSHVKLVQYINIDDPYCSNQAHWVGLTIGLQKVPDPAGSSDVMAVLTMNSYEIHLANSYCHNQYWYAIDQAIAEGAGPLNEGLKIFSGEFRSTYYFTPTESPELVYGNWGSELPL